jgi:hypothetical protein
MNAPDVSVIEAAAKKAWPSWKNDCSGFVRAVASDLGIAIAGNANAMVDVMNAKAGG